MEKPVKKPQAKVVALKGAFARDVVTREEMAEAAALQAAAWRANKAAEKANQRIQCRIEHGAQVEPCEFHFDYELEMVRTRRGKKTG